ncbi:copper resistance protein B [Peristeroidobacter soli]|jgi:copper resistance protein B|uniref:copper resistance protein B n=1 Tax=Peristeroidobacter soli TaxID=2497877 RepID=UPI0013007925|nr:copper resistance protein B [Peristeroidobacter soli]
MSALIKLHVALALFAAVVTTAAAQDEQRTESERAHIPPDPPQHEMGDMSEKEMAELMNMDDTAPFGMVAFDQLEWRDSDGGDTLFWDGRAWFGNDYDKALLKTEGERFEGEYEGSVELLWDRVISRWWSLQGGVAHDFGEGPSRTWAAFGLQGLAPYWFEVEALAYVGEQGRTAASFSAEYEMFLTQRLVLQPKLELKLYGKDDPANGIGSGFSSTELGLRLRYEIRREFAPYLGVVWSRKFGETADLARNHGDDADELQLVAGLRVWF